MFHKFFPTSLGSLCWPRGVVYFTMHTSAGSFSTPLYKYFKSDQDTRKKWLVQPNSENMGGANCGCWEPCVSVCCRHRSGLTKQNFNQPEDKVKMQTLNLIFFVTFCNWQWLLTKYRGKSLVVIKGKGQWEVPWFGDVGGRHGFKTRQCGSLFS